MGSWGSLPPAGENPPKTSPWGAGPPAGKPRRGYWGAHSALVPEWNGPNPRWCWAGREGPCSLPPTLASRGSSMTFRVRSRLPQPPSWGLARGGLPVGSQQRRGHCPRAPSWESFWEEPGGGLQGRASPHPRPDRKVNSRPAQGLEPGCLPGAGVGVGGCLRRALGISGSRGAPRPPPPWATRLELADCLSPLNKTLGNSCSLETSSVGVGGPG